MHTALGCTAMHIKKEYQCLIERSAGDLPLVGDMARRRPSPADRGGAVAVSLASGGAGSGERSVCAALQRGTHERRARRAHAQTLLCTLPSSFLQLYLSSAEIWNLEDVRAEYELVVVLSCMMHACGD